MVPRQVPKAKGAIGTALVVVLPYRSLAAVLPELPKDYQRLRLKFLPYFI